MLHGRFPYALLTLALAAAPAFGQGSPEDSTPRRPTHSIMHFSLDWMRAHRVRRAAMRVRQAGPLPGLTKKRPVGQDTYGVNLLTHLNLNACGGASGWDQGQCGNCWVFGSTAACSIDAGVALGTPQLFSPQWFDSDYYATENTSTCQGGDTSEFADWYNSHLHFIPWTNTNAAYADQNGPDTPATPASSIAQTPNVGLTGITASQIATANVSQAQAIANIKSVLDSNQAVTLSFFLPGAGWTDFDNAWDSNTETTPWAGVDSYNGTTMDAEGGGHLVCVVGYDDTNNTWVLRNSWGATQGRPDGTFELPQTMGYGDTMNYDGSMNQYEFDTYEPVGWSGAVTAPSITTQPASQTLNAGQSATFTVVATGSAPLAYQWYRNGQAINGATYSNYVTPVLAASDNGSTFYAVVSNADGSVTSATATLTVNAPTVLDLMVNGGFESGTQGWTAPGGLIGQHAPQEPAYAGTWDAWFGASSPKAWTTLAQSVTIPANVTTATLSFYLHVDTREVGTGAKDVFIVQVRSNQGTRLTTLDTFSNLNAASGYQMHTYDLSAYRGQNLQLSFSNARENSYMTSFVLDAVSLKCH